ncbi:MAG: ABC transporter ATP-binding protein [Candidatus Woesearchaeota archaeon]
MIHIQHLSKTYTVTMQAGILKNIFAPQKKQIHAVNDISFDIDKKEIIGFIGPNGAGKTTTIKMLCGILHPTQGSVSVLGYNPHTQRKAYLHHIGAVFGQKKSLWPELSVLDNLELIGSLYGLSTQQVHERIDELAHHIPIQDFLHQPFRKLSLGQQMKSELIGNILHKPRILFLDEPTIGMDIIAKLSFISLLKSLDVTILLTSHDLHEIETLCKRVIIMNKGSIVYDGLTKDIRPEHVRITYVHHNKMITKKVAKSKLKQAIAKLPTNEFHVQEIPIQDIIKDFYQ